MRSEKSNKPRYFSTQKVMHPTIQYVVTKATETASRFEASNMTNSCRSTSTNNSVDALHLQPVVGPMPDLRVCSLAEAYVLFLYATGNPIERDAATCLGADKF